MAELRKRLRPALTVLAGAVVWFVLVAPDRVDRWSPSALVRVPLEALVLVALALLLPRRAARALALVFGGLLALLLVLKLLDLGFSVALDRPFDPVDDGGYTGPALGVLRDSVGLAGTVGVVVAILLAVLALLWLLPAGTWRVLRSAREHRRTALVAVAALALVWATLALAGVRTGHGRVASASAAGLLSAEVGRVHGDLTDQKPFDHLLRADAYAGLPDARLLRGLRGKDVLVVFVESYGRVAVQGTSFSPGVDAVLDRGTRELAAAGWSSRSAFLTSPTFGGISWLAHSTFESGVWVDSQHRYARLLTSHRLTLADAFHRAGWRTVFDIPSVTRPWPEGQAFYHFDQLYDATNVGYRGPSFSYATMPDQYTMAALWRNELSRPHHRPVMAEVDLVSSHTPWTPLPRLVPWSRVGDGSVFAGQPATGGPSATALFGHPDQVRAAYGRSVEYSWRTLLEFLQQHPDPRLVVVALGDHQPHTIVTGAGVDHDVPISVIARDPRVTAAIDGWRWPEGLHPGPDAPVWRMDAFRDRFLAAYEAR